MPSSLLLAPSTTQEFPLKILLSSALHFSHSTGPFISISVCCYFSHLKKILYLNTNKPSGYWHISFLIFIANQKQNVSFLEISPSCNFHNFSLTHFKQKGFCSHGADKAARVEEPDNAILPNPTVNLCCSS